MSVDFSRFKKINACDLCSSESKYTMLELHRAAVVMNTIRVQVFAYRRQTLNPNITNYVFYYAGGSRTEFYEIQESILINGTEKQLIRFDIF